MQLQFAGSWRPDSANGADEVCVLFGESSYFKEGQFFVVFSALIGWGPPHYGELSPLLIKMLISSRSTRRRTIRMFWLDILGCPMTVKSTHEISHHSI